MITFVLCHDGAFASLVVTTHRNRVLAEAWLQRNSCPHSVVVDKEEDLPGSASAELLALYRSLGGDASLRAVSRGRVFEALDLAFNNQPYAELPHPHERQPKGRENKTMTETTASTAKAPKAAKAKAPKTTKAAAAPKATRSKGKAAGKVADFKQVRDGTRRAAVLRLMDGTRTAEQMAAQLSKDLKVDFTPASVSANLFCLHRDTGIGYAFDDAGRVSAAFPGSKTLADALKPAEAEKPPKAAKAKAAKPAKAKAAKKTAAPPAAAAA